jgi:hypothetical protein
MYVGIPIMVGLDRKIVDANETNTSFNDPFSRILRKSYEVGVERRSLGPPC